MEKYSKIQSVFFRDPDNNHKTFLMGEWSVPEFELLKDIDWIWTEKIDGTNIRVIWDGETLTFKGRTDRASIPTMLLETLVTMFPIDKVRDTFDITRSDEPICLYGEGYGHKIQGCGSRYLHDRNSFILFDAKIGNYWLEYEHLVGLARGLDIPIVPLIGQGTLWGAIKMTEQGFKSQISEDEDLIAEGLILKPKVGLFNRSHNRIITKIKHKDFQ
jgi:hypothetical protein